MKFQHLLQWKFILWFFCIIVLHSVVGQHQHFKGAYCFYHQYICPKHLYPSTSAHHVIIQKTGGSISGSGVPRNFFQGGCSTNSVEDRGQRGRGSGGGSPLVRGSGGSCNLVQEISFHIVKFS